MALAYKLTQIPLAPDPICVARASPRCELCAQTTTLAGRPRPAQECDEGFQRLGHVLVAKVPGRYFTAIHGAVILLGIANQPGVLLGVEVLVFRDLAILPGVFRGISPQLDELSNYLGFTGVPQTEARRERPYAWLSSP